MVEVTRAQTPFAMVPLWVLELSAPAVKMYAVLWRYADNQTRSAWPSRPRLAADMGFKQARSIDPIIKELEDAGAVTVTRGKDTQGINLPNRYHLNLEQGSAVQSTTVVHDSAKGSAGQRTTVVHQNALELEPSIYNQEQEAASPSPYTDEFEEAWKLYPRHDDKKAAFRAYKAARKIVGADVILAGVNRYRKEDPKRELRFTKLFSTWLNAGSWENNVVPIGARPQAAPQGDGMRLGWNYGNAASTSTR